MKSINVKVIDKFLFLLEVYSNLSFFKFNLHNLVEHFELFAGY